MAEYTNWDVFIVSKTATFPFGIKAPTPGEAANSGRLKDGRAWFKNGFMNADEIRNIVHAEDAGTVQIKTAEEMRAIMQAQEKPIEIIR